MNADAVSLDAESETRWESLRRALSRTDGFGFFVVLADGIARGEVLRRLDAWSTTGAIPRIERFAGGDAGAEQLARRIGGETASTAGWVLTGDALGLGEDRAGGCEALNLARDRLWKIVPGPLVLVIASEQAAELQARATDLYEVRKGTWQLRSRAPERIREIVETHGARMDLDAIRTWARDLDENEREGRGQASGWADERVSVALALFTCGDRDAAVAEARRAESIARGVGYTNGVAVALDALARIALNEGEFATADGLVTEALGVDGQSPATRSEGLYLAAQIAMLRGNYVGALEWSQRGAAEALQAGEPELEAMHTQGIARIERARGRLEAAVQLLRERVIPALEALGRPALLASAWSDLGDALRARGDLAEAAEVFERQVMPRLEDETASQHQRAIAASQLGDVLELQGRLAEALRLHREVALPEFERTGNVREQAITLGKIADVTQGQGALDEALRIRREEELPRLHHVGDRREAAIASSKVAWTLIDLDRLDEAERVLCVDVLPVFAAMNNDSEVANSRLQLARIECARGNPHRAVRILEQQVMPVQRAHGDFHELAYAQLYYAHALARTGRLADAEHVAEREVLAAAQKMGAVTLVESAQILLDDIRAQMARSTEIAPSRNRAERRAAAKRR